MLIICILFRIILFTPILAQNQFTSIWQNKTQEEIGAILKNIETESPRFV